MQYRFRVPCHVCRCSVNRHLFQIKYSSYLILVGRKRIFRFSFYYIIHGTSPVSHFVFDISTVILSNISTTSLIVFSNTSHKPCAVKSLNASLSKIVINHCLNEPQFFFFSNLFDNIIWSTSHRHWLIFFSSFSILKSSHASDYKSTRLLVHFLALSFSISFQFLYHPLPCQFIMSLSYYVLYLLHTNCISH